jgi:hypothetical protein
MARRSNHAMAMPISLLMTKRGAGDGDEILAIAAVDL